MLFKQVTKFSGFSFPNYQYFAWIPVTTIMGIVYENPFQHSNSAHSDSGVNQLALILLSVRNSRLRIFILDLLDDAQRTIHQLYHQYHIISQQMKHFNKWLELKDNGPVAIELFEERDDLVLSPSHSLPLAVKMQWLPRGDGPHETAFNFRNWHMGMSCYFFSLDPTEILQYLKIFSDMYQ